MLLLVQVSLTQTWGMLVMLTEFNRNEEHTTDFYHLRTCWLIPRIPALQSSKTGELTENLGPVWTSKDQDKETGTQ